MPPRAALTIRTVGLTRRSCSSPISPTVSAVLGRWMEMKSDSRSISSSETSRTPSWAARAAGMYGSYAISSTPKPPSRVATRTPIRPRPTMPTTLPCSSMPVYWDRCQRPPLSVWSATATFRAVASSNATACSAADTMLDCGALTTMTPALVAAGTSTLSRPTPARAMTRNRGAAARASASTLVALRMINASTSARAGSSASRSAPSTWRTSYSSSSRAIPAGDSSSATRTTGLVTVPVPLDPSTPWLRRVHAGTEHTGDHWLDRGERTQRCARGVPASVVGRRWRPPCGRGQPGGSVDPAHHGAEGGAGLLDLALPLGLSHRGEGGRAVVILVDPALGEGAVADRCEDSPHFRARLLGDDTRSADVAAVLRGVRYRPPHLRQSALVHKVHDELHLVKALEVGNLRLIAGLDQRGKTRLDQLGYSPAQDGLLAE